jgi:thiamine monophosphate synthase
VCKSLKPFPVIALGGIDESNYSKVLQAGARGYAAIRFLNELLKSGDAKKQERIEN